MKINVNSVTQEQKSTIVRFNCAAGVGTGIWIGSKKPIKDLEYSIEVDIEKALDALVCLQPVGAEKSITVLDRKVILTVKVEGVDVDGMCYLRLGADSLIMIERGKKQVEIGQYLTLELLPKDLELTPQ